MNRLIRRVKVFFNYRIMNSKFCYFIYIILMNILSFNILMKKINFLLNKNQKLLNHCTHTVNFIKKGYLNINQHKFNSEAYIISDYILQHAEKKNLGIRNKNKIFEKILQTEDLLSDEKVFNFVTNDYLINLVECYLENKVQILHSSVWYSYNDIKKNGSSQEFHTDHEDVKQVKLFLFLNDISKENGPTIVFNKSQSNEMIRKLKYKKLLNAPSRIPDIKVNLENADYLVGKKGSTYLIDTSNLLHCGSRMGSGLRKVFMVQYVSPYTTSENKDIINKRTFLSRIEGHENYSSKKYLFDSLFF